MSYDIDKLRESELTDHLKKEEQELSLVDHLREVTEEKKDLERQLEEAKQNIYKFAEIALMEGKDEFGHSWEDFKLYVLDEQLKEKGE